MRRPLGFHTWFIVGYPDVAVWFDSNMEDIIKILQENEAEYADDLGLKPKFYRDILIDTRILKFLNVQFKANYGTRKL